MRKRLLIVLIPVVLLSCPKKNPTRPDTGPGLLEEIDGVLPNPFKGFAPWVGTENPVCEATLQYVNLTWRELEPIQGMFNFARMERGWGDIPATGKRVGFRVSAAMPGEAGHADIPQWLVDQGVRMRTYEIDGASGLAPDWDDPKFLAAHHDFIAALGARYDTDPRVAWIDIGSYGFWGEWHVWMNDSLAAKQSSKEAILDDYFLAFPTKMKVIAFDDDFATRRVAEHGGGIRNDCLGTPESNDWYLESLRQADPGLNDRVWKTAMIGGEFCGGSQGAVEGTTARFDLNFDFIQKTHWSFIGPAGGAVVPRNEAHRENLIRLHEKLGYRFVLVGVEYAGTVKRGDALSLQIRGENRGVAPFYFEWPLVFYLTGASGEAVLQRVLEVDIRKWLPGGFSENVTVQIPSSLAPQTCDVRLAILDPAFGRPGVAFANKGRDGEGRLCVGRVGIE